MGMLAKIRRMHLRDGLSIREVSRRTGLSKNTVKRWLRQEGVHTIDASLRRENLAKLDQLPLIQRVPSAPADAKTGQRIRLSLESIDFLTLELACRYLETLAPAADVEEISEEIADAID